MQGLRSTPLPPVNKSLEERRRVRQEDLAKVHLVDNTNEVGTQCAWG